ncbi:MAG: RNA 2'-phosphotransferase [Archaeoglobales archaeon]|jgi:putative RNA 2'-phosphotransferase|nr:RNA 2'-phosphotransferase [Archaeoglobi archaeon]NHW23309.1 RNA 2'-phosphotransferase [Archaeoglobales archaeon]
MEEIRFCPSHGFYRGETCACGVKGEIVVSKEKVERLGKFVSGVLRHFPQKFGLEIDENGWVSFEDLARLVSRKYRWANRWVLKALIYSDEKKRYEIRGDRIRARYGHSIDVKLNDMPEAQEDTLYYGTSEEEANRMMEIGIKPVNQAYVHLSTTIEKSLEVASLRTRNPIIFEIDAKRARADGIRILKANDSIALAKEIPSKYIKKMIQYSSS